MKKLVLYIHGQGGSPEEAAHYRPLLPGSDVKGLDYKARTPGRRRRSFPGSTTGSARAMTPSR